MISNKDALEALNRLYGYAEDCFDNAALEDTETIRNALREYRDENARLRDTISQVEYLIGKGLHEISAAYSPDDMSIAGRAEMQLALNVISGEALKGKEE